MSLDLLFFNLTIQDYFIASRWNRPGTANVVEVRTLVPFKVWDQENLLRINVPFRTQSELGPGLSDVRIFDLITFKSGRAVWGVGPAFNLGINRGPGIDAVQAGPAAGVIIPAPPALTVGLLNQNFFSSQVALTTLQPILLLALSKSWSVGLGDFPLVYNWKEGSFAVFSLGLRLGFRLTAADQPVHLFVNPTFNTKSSTELYKWTIASGVTLPLTPTD